MADNNALRTNQAMIVLLVTLGFVLGEDNGGIWLVALVALSLLAGVIWPGNGPFQLFYGHGLVGPGLVKPDLVVGDPAKYRFAQLMGAAVLALAFVLLVAGAETAGWVLAFVVVALALVNLIFGFCLGCQIYLRLQQFRLQRG